MIDLVEVVELLNDPNKLYHLRVRNASHEELVEIAEMLKSHETIKAQFIVTSEHFNILGEVRKAENSLYIARQIEVEELDLGDLWRVRP